MVEARDKLHTISRKVQVIKLLIHSSRAYWQWSWAGAVMDAHIFVHIILVVGESYLTDLLNVQGASVDALNVVFRVIGFLVENRVDICIQSNFFSIKDA